jgi:hypothetical protein
MEKKEPNILIFCACFIIVLPVFLFIEQRRIKNERM